MSLDKLKIPGLILKELYPNQLVQPVGAQEETDPDTATVPNHEVVVIVNMISAAERQILDKILQACKWPPARTTLINLGRQPLSWQQIKQNGLPRICLLLGPDAAAIDLPVIFPPFRIQPFDTVKFVAAPGLAVIEEDRLLKSKLWLCLKELFNTA
jgi:hypothetical protein